MIVPASRLDMLHRRAGNTKCFSFNCYQCLCAGPVTYCDRMLDDMFYASVPGNYAIRDARDKTVRTRSTDQSVFQYGGAFGVRDVFPHAGVEPLSGKTNRKEDMAISP